MDFDGVDCFFLKNDLDFNCDAEVIVTNIWFCADIVSTPVDKDNKSYPTPPHKICILFSRDFESENLSQELSALVLWFYSLQHMAAH